MIQFSSVLIEWLNLAIKTGADNLALPYLTIYIYRIGTLFQQMLQITDCLHGILLFNFDGKILQIPAKFSLKL